MWQIEQVPPSKELEGLTLVVGAGRADSQVLAGLDSLRAYLAGLNRDDYSLWWARDAKAALAAALLVRSPGRTGTILNSSTDYGMIPQDALAQLLETMTRLVLGPDLVLVQSLLWPYSAGDARAYEAAGYSLLAELIYMRLMLRGRTIPPAIAEVPLEFLRYAPQTHSLFAGTILASYQDSLDCPALEGLRGIDDILAGHKASGLFRPDLWIVAVSAGQPAGVLLLNENIASSALEVSYVGVTKAFRGKGLGRALLAKAAELAVSERLSTISLAVDARNHYAMRLYERTGFVEYARRLAYMRTWRSAEPAATPLVQAEPS